MKIKLIKRLTLCMIFIGPALVPPALAMENKKRTSEHLEIDDEILSKKQKLSYKKELNFILNTDALYGLRIITYKYLMLHHKQDMEEILQKAATSTDESFLCIKEYQQSINNEFYYAVKDEDSEKVEECLQLGADVNQQIFYWCEHTALFYICNQLNLKIAELLIMWGADINLCCSHNWNPLKMASYTNHVQLVNLLLEMGVLLHEKYEIVKTVLYDAIYNNNLPMLKLLIEYGAHLDQETINTAIYQGSPSLVTYMEAMQAFFNNSNKLGFILNTEQPYAARISAYRYMMHHPELYQNDLLKIYRYFWKHNPNPTILIDLFSNIDFGIQDAIIIPLPLQKSLQCLDENHIKVKHATEEKISWEPNLMCKQYPNKEAAKIILDAIAQAENNLREFIRPDKTRYAWLTFGTDSSLEVKTLTMTEDENNKLVIEEEEKSIKKQCGWHHCLCWSIKQCISKEKIKNLKQLAGFITTDWVWGPTTKKNIRSLLNQSPDK